MKTLLRLGAAFLAGTMASGPVRAQAAPPTVAPTSADHRLTALYDAYATWDAKASGGIQDESGETKPADDLARVDAASQLRRAAHRQDVLNQLNAIPAAQLSPDEQVNAAVCRTL